MEKLEKEGGPFDGLRTPGAEAPEHQRRLKMTLLGSQRSAAIGVWLAAVPAYFIFCVFMKYFFHLNLHIFDVMEEMIASLDKDPLMHWLAPALLVGFPLLSVVVNLLAIMHVAYGPDQKELQISIKLKWRNIAMAAISAAIVGVFLLYAIAENMRSH